MDKETLKKQLEWPGEVTPIAWVLMQSLAVGGTSESIAKGLGVEPSEIDQLIEELRKETAGKFDQGIALLRIDLTGGVFERDFGWDDLERVVLQKLKRVVNLEKDTDVLTRVAVAANRAKRSTDTGPRTDSNGTVVLPGGAIGHIQLDISHRIAVQLQGKESAAPVTIEGEAKRVTSDRLEMLNLKEVRSMISKEPPKILDFDSSIDEMNAVLGIDSKDG